ncbi:hypothetical protein CAAN1_22S00782 [[Candida] anglica]|uniref:Uncharacterized protein n=1 Tax=[Candida] anglica TaxID=148631 RepID=A0ABP0EPR1_9ASCO
MWPFSSSNQGKKTSDLEKEIPDSLKDIFHKGNPEWKNEANFGIAEEEKLVEMAKQRQSKEPYSYEFDDYKRNEDHKKVTYINCVELQKNVISCLKNWKGADLSFCDKEMKLNSACTDIQTKALKRLRYDECVSIKQCKQIRFLIDDLFVKNFGQLGEHFDDQTYAKFSDEVDASFVKIWK